MEASKYKFTNKIDIVLKNEKLLDFIKKIGNKACCNKCECLACEAIELLREIGEYEC